jgi:mRNA-degrading endonuclease YafQ of YafQ-DinJ toxin-antitoxin module
MPYVVRGSTVYKRNGKKLTKKAKAKSKASAGRMLRLLLKEDHLAQVYKQHSKEKQKIVDLLMASLQECIDEDKELS